MITLSNLHNTRYTKKPKRLGRGVGSGKGKTSGKGQKGGSSRSGYRTRLGNEGGQLEFFRKLPCKGFSNALFKVTYEVINLDRISQIFEDGETVSQETLRQKGYISGRKQKKVKILGKGDLTKKIAAFEVDAISSSAQAKLEKAGVPVTLIGNE